MAAKKKTRARKAASKKKATSRRRNPAHKAGARKVQTGFVVIAVNTRNNKRGYLSHFGGAWDTGFNTDIDKAIFYSSEKNALQVARQITADEEWALLVTSAFRHPK